MDGQHRPGETRGEAARGVGDVGWRCFQPPLFPTSNMRTGGRTNPTTSLRAVRTAWCWCPTRSASGTTCPATTTCPTSARKAQVLLVCQSHPAATRIPIPHPSASSSHPSAAPSVIPLLPIPTTPASPSHGPSSPHPSTPIPQHPHPMAPSLPIAASLSLTPLPWPPGTSSSSGNLSQRKLEQLPLISIIFSSSVVNSSLSTLICLICHH